MFNSHSISSRIINLNNLLYLSWNNKMAKIMTQLTEDEEIIKEMVCGCKIYFTFLFFLFSIILYFLLLLYYFL